MKIIKRRPLIPQKSLNLVLNVCEDLAILRHCNLFKKNTNIYIVILLYLDENHRKASINPQKILKSGHECVCGSGLPPDTVVEIKTIQISIS